MELKQSKKRKQHENTKRTKNTKPQKHTGGTLDWPLPNLSKLVKWHYENNVIFRDALSWVVKRNPNKPISLIPYSDEYTPGNVLHPEQRKKRACGISVCCSSGKR